MESLKPIQTEYKGYKFRSRLEARWAVFFDEMGIDYEYELEGFDLEAGRYLPDFYLTKINVFVEIKPADTQINIYDLKRYDELAITHNKALLLIIGTPLKQEFLILDRRTSYPIQDIIEELVPETKDAGIINEYLGRLRELGRVGFGFVPGHHPRSLIYGVESADPWTQLCLEKARQMRFEFRERAN